MSEDYLVQQPTATWNPARGVWEKPGMANLLCEHWELYSEVWQTSGMMRNGQVFELPMQAHLTTDSESLSLPTPTTVDGRLNASPSNLERNTPPLGAVVHNLLPTPQTMDTLPARTGEARERQLRRGEGEGASRRTSSGNLREDILDLIPTPTTRDYKDGSAPHERDGEVQTDTVARAIFNSGEIRMLPTPQVDDGKNTGHNQDRRTTLASEVWGTERTTAWGKFEPAIRRWEQVLGRSAPAPTKPDGKGGAHRLSSRFTEWMMGLPDGWITDAGLKRNDELKACGNGVVPQQAELALRILLGADSTSFSDLPHQLMPTPTTMDAKATNSPEVAQKFLDEGKQTCLTYEIVTREREK